MASSGQARLSSSSKMPINYVRVENPSEQEEELSKMDTQGVHEALRYALKASVVQNKSKYP